MIDHVSIPVRDVKASARFYEALLTPLGMKRAVYTRGDALKDADHATRMAAIDDIGRGTIEASNAREAWIREAEAAIRSLGDINGRIILDATNPLVRGPDGINLEIGHSTSAGEKVQGWAKGASVFKTLNTTGFGNMANPIFNGVKSVMFVAGDDAANKPKVMALVAELGFEVIDAGPLRQARLLEAHAMLWIDLALARGLGRDWAFARVKR